MTLTEALNTLGIGSLEGFVNPEATVRERYRRLAMQHHPDHNPHDPDAVRRFRHIDTAYRQVVDHLTSGHDSNHADPAKVAYRAFDHARQAWRDGHLDFELPQSTMPLTVWAKSEVERILLVIGIAVTGAAAADLDHIIDSICEILTEQQSNMADALGMFRQLIDEILDEALNVGAA